MGSQTSYGKVSAMIVSLAEVTGALLRLHGKVEKPYRPVESWSQTLSTGVSLVLSHFHLLQCGVPFSAKLYDASQPAWGKTILNRWGTCHGQTKGVQLAGINYTRDRSPPVSNR